MDYINGAYHEEINDIWYPIQWGINGIIQKNHQIRSY